MSFFLKLILTDLAALALLFLALFLVRDVFRITRNGFCVRRRKFRGEMTDVSVVDSIVLFGNGISRRSLMIKGGCHGSVPLGKHKDELVYAVFCKDFLELLGEKEIKNTLTLGGGAGAVPFYTYRRYNAASDVIEINKECIDTAEKYFTFGAGINYIRADALEGAKKLLSEGKRYQFVFCDLFVGLAPAKVVFEKELTDTVSALIGDEGLFVMNGTSQDVKSIKTILGNAERAFSQIALFTLKNMFVLCGTNRTDIELIKVGNKKNGMFPVYPKTPFIDIIQR